MRVAHLVGFMLLVMETVVAPVARSDADAARRAKPAEVRMATAYFGLPDSLRLSTEQKSQLVALYRELAPKLAALEAKAREFEATEEYQRKMTPRRRSNQGPKLPASHAKDKKGTLDELKSTVADARKRAYDLLDDKQRAKLSWKPEEPKVEQPSKGKAAKSQKTSKPQKSST